MMFQTRCFKLESNNNNNNINGLIAAYLHGSSNEYAKIKEEKTLN